MERPHYTLVHDRTVSEIIRTIKEHREQEKKQDYLFIHDLSNKYGEKFSMIDNCYLTNYNEIRNFIDRMCRHMHTISNCQNCMKCFNDECMMNSNNPVVIDKIFNHMEKINGTACFVLLEYY